MSELLVALNENGIYIVTSLLLFHLLFHQALDGLLWLKELEVEIRLRTKRKK